MFDFSSTKAELLTPLLTIAGAVDKKQSLQILSNILLRVKSGQLTLTATDLEIEISAILPNQIKCSDCAITIPAKKMVDIIKALDDDAKIRFVGDEKSTQIKSGRSQFKLKCLPADDYPNTEQDANLVELQVPRTHLIQLFQSTHFALSQQDIRVFLNGLLLELNPDVMTAVAMDGHRMAVYSLKMEIDSSFQRVVIPRKGIQESLRLLNAISDETVLVCSGKNHFRIVTEQYQFVSKLIETRFPAYQKAIPKGQDKQVIVEREQLKRALMRSSILANEKSRAVKLIIETNQLTVSANNPEQEEAYETITAETKGNGLQIGLNASYLMDVLNYLDDEKICMSFLDDNSSILVEPLKQQDYQYVVMPMKI